jgi:hypothetical protein
MPPGERMAKFLTATILILVLQLGQAFAQTYCPSQSTDCGASRPHKARNGNVVISNVCDLQAIQTTVKTNYSIVPENHSQEIDATCTATWNGGAGFVPISGVFVGKLNGNGFPINGLVIHSSSASTGLLQHIGASGVVEHVAITNASVSTSIASWEGILTSYNEGTVSFAYITGCIGAPPGCSYQPGLENSVGGIVGYNPGTISNSFFNGSGFGYSVGGIASSVAFDSGAIVNSGSSGNLQGLIDIAGVAGSTAFGGRVSYSWSTANAQSLEEIAAGLVGNLNGTTEPQSVQHSYSSGTVLSADIAGGLIGQAGQTNIADAYSVGQVGGTNADVGGFLGIDYGGNTYSNAYWDSLTSDQLKSAGGKKVKPLDTTSFKAMLPKGFSNTDWSSVVGQTYPFLIAYSCPYPEPSGGPLKPSYCNLTPAKNVSATENCPKVDKTADEPMYFCDLTQLMAVFQPPLAQFGNPSPIAAFIPAGQLQLFQYYRESDGSQMLDGKHTVASEACFGTVYTMLARFIGAAHPEATVTYNPNIIDENSMSGVSEPASQAHIDSLLDKNGGGIWPDSLSTYATWSTTWTKLSDDAAAERRVEGGQQLILHGTTSNRFEHVMLVTSVIKDQSGNVIRLVANDPEIGQQLFIDMTPGPTYHQAVLDPFNVQDSNGYSKLTAFGFTADKYKYVIWNYI